MRIIIKKLLSRNLLNFAFISVMCVCLWQCGQTDTMNSLASLRTTSTMQIDGRLTEPVWQQTESVLLKENRTGNPVSSQSVLTWVRTCYDDSTLYIAFECNDPDIWTNYTERDEYLWQEEAVEVFIDTDDVPETYVEIEISPANVLFDSYIVDPVDIDIQATAEFDLAGIQHAVVVNGTLNQRDDRDSSWVVEIAVPFRDLVTERNRMITTSTNFRINFYRLDKNTGMESAGYAWSPTGARFHKPEVFGRLVFK